MTTLLTTDDREKLIRRGLRYGICHCERALTYVASFDAPTSEVYEIWYRFAEGYNPDLTTQLSFAVNELKSVNRSRIEQMDQEFFARQNCVRKMLN